jgi:L-threonylcarbamoyladenylate synthase
MEISTEIREAAAALAAGRLVAFPTETVYGLGADATSDSAVAAVFAAKARPSFNPLIVHVADAASAFELGGFNDDAMKLARAFWPGPLTIVVPRLPNCPVSLLASAGHDSLAIRVPAHPLAHQLLVAYGKPVVAPSANRSGRLSPTTADHVRKALGGKVAMVLDGGPCSIGVESTVVGITGREAELLRAGGVSRSDIASVLGHEPAEPAGGPLRSPGQLESHYAPHAKLRLNAKRPGDNEAYLGFGLYSHGAYNLSPKGDLAEAAANLFRMLHEIDAQGAEAIAIAPVPSHGLGEAINDRLRRAAAPRTE